MRGRRVEEGSRYVRRELEGACVIEYVMGGGQKMGKEERFEKEKRIQAKKMAGEMGTIDVRKGREWRGNERRRRERVEMRGEARRM